LLTVLLGVPVHFPALAVTRTWMFSSSVEVVSVVDVPVTVFFSACTRFRTRPDSTVYCVAPVTDDQLTGIVAVVVSPLVVHVIAPMVTFAGVPIWPALAVPVPGGAPRRGRHAAAGEQQRDDHGGDGRESRPPHALVIATVTGIVNVAFWQPVSDALDIDAALFRVSVADPFAGIVVPEDPEVSVTPVVEHEPVPPVAVGEPFAVTEVRVTG
jgi:hypothetical protein